MILIDNIEVFSKKGEIKNEPSIHFHIWVWQKAALHFWLIKVFLIVIIINLKKIYSGWIWAKKIKECFKHISFLNDFKGQIHFVRKKYVKWEMSSRLERKVKAKDKYPRSVIYLPFLKSLNDTLLFT